MWQSLLNNKYVFFQLVNQETDHLSYTYAFLALKIQSIQWEEYPLHDSLTISQETH